MPTLKPSVPTHLSIFVTKPDTGRPVAQVPLYAEVAVPRIVPVPPINERFRAPMRTALSDVDPTATDPAVRDRVEAAAFQALAETVDEASRNQLVTRPERPSSSSNSLPTNWMRCSSTVAAHSTSCGWLTEARGMVRLPSVS